MKKARIAYVTETSPDDKHAWSGTVHYVYKALQDYGFEVTPLGPQKPLFIQFLLATANQVSLFLFKKRFDYRHSTPYSKAFGRIFTKKLEKIPHDIVVVCGGTEYGAYLNTTRPVYYILDRTIQGSINYHTILSRLWHFSEQQSVSTDRTAMRRATKIFFSSEWAASQARNKYLLSAAKIRVLPFGANLDKTPDRETALQPKNSGRLNLLLIGTYWKNKGADIAFNALLHLLKNKVNAWLTVVGCQPPDELKHERLTIIPFVDKNSETGSRQLWELFLSHHFFILPTRFDCTPIVFCEASSFSLPVISARTGGVEGHVKEGVNGFLIPYEDQGPGYAEKIMEIMRDQTAYEDLRRSTRRYFEEHLNWKVWSEGFANEIAF